MKFVPACFATLLLCGGSFADVRITEFVADNDGSHLDDDGDVKDWLELYNDGDSAVDLGGWSLTDDASNLQKWVFPSGSSIAPGEFLVIYASGKDRRILGETFHCNFSLKKSGEYLALVQEDGTTVAHEFAPTFPPQFEGMSYGLDQSGGTVEVVASGAAGRAGVPTSLNDFNNNYDDWNSSKTGSFNASSWRSVSTGVGYERSAGYGVWLGTDLESSMYNQNASVFLRVPFEVSNAAAVSALSLRMRWDDGFEAFINGVRVAGDRVPGAVTWNARSASSRGDGENDDWASFPIVPGGLGLVDGTNILAIQGFNQSETSSDMLILPELDIEVTGSTSSTQAYQTNPSPGAANQIGTLEVPPMFGAVTDEAERPAGGAASAPILVTAEVGETVANLDEVRLYHRIMFDSEQMLVMRDDGTLGDLLADDGIYTASVPTVGLSAGEMIRWRIEAEDVLGEIATAPDFVDPDDSDRYFGTVAATNSFSSSLLPVIESFVEDEEAAETRGGTRVSIYHLGEFYDNVQMDLHGQSTAGDAFPKKSYDVDFNKGSRFRWKEGEERVKDVNLLTNWADKSKMRNTLGYEFLKACGAGHHFAYAVRVERNGSFFSVVDMVEDGDDRFLERIGLDGDGALYKMYDRMVDPARAAKKTRKEEGTADLAALYAGINEGRSREERRRYAYDNIDIPATVNHLAAYVVAGISDTGHKNYYMYRDTEGDGEWFPLPWDVDLSAGRRWNSTDLYFDDRLFNTLWTHQPNPLWELIYQTPEYREMFVRRVRSLREQVLLAPGTPEGQDWFVQRIEALKDQIDPVGITSDADLDYSKWGSWGNRNRVRTAADRIIDEWLPEKRNYIFSGSRNQNGTPIPPAQPSSPNVDIVSVYPLPSSGNQDEEYLILQNKSSSSVDLSGWMLTGGVTHVFPPGTVIPAGSGSSGDDYIGLLHVARDAVGFRGVRGQRHRFVSGGYEGQLSARGETLELRTAAGVLVDQNTYPGNPTEAQLALRVTELNYHPADPSQAELIALPGVQAEDFEYIELMNIGGSTLDLEGCRFTEGVDYTFGVGVSLGAGSRLILCKSLEAFALRYPGVSATVVGPYVGQLNNDGESLRLVDGLGENVLTFSYNDRWYPPSDGGGHSLVLRDPETAYDGLDALAAWAVSGAESGSPGEGDDQLLTHFNAWQEGMFTAAEWNDPLVGGPLADPDFDKVLNWEEYAFGLNPKVPDTPLFRSEIIEVDGVPVLAATVRRLQHSSDLIWTLETGEDLEALSPGIVEQVDRTDHGDGTETVTLREEATAEAGAQRFLRLKLEHQP